MNNKFDDFLIQAGSVEFQRISTKCAEFVSPVLASLCASVLLFLQDSPLLVQVSTGVGAKLRFFMFLFM
jgi:hypothetical protein